MVAVKCPTLTTRGPRSEHELKEGGTKAKTMRVGKCASGAPRHAREEGIDDSTA